MFKEFTRSQDYLFPPSLIELIPPNDMVFTVARVCDQLDLSSLYTKYSNLGQNAYHPAMLISVLLYAYSVGVLSSRKIEDRLHKDACFMFIAGMQKPDFRTIANFRRDNKDFIDDCFVQVLHICQQTGHINLRTIAHDGSKIAANASSKQTKKRSKLEEEIAALQAEAKRRLEAAETVDAAEEQAETFGKAAGKYRNFTPEELKKKLLAAKQILDQQPNRSNVNLTDPECGIHKTKGAVYNAQIAVDCDNLFIVAAEAVSDTNDRKQLLPMMEKVEENTASQGEKKAVLTDCGYASAEAFQAVEKRPHIDLYTPTQEQVMRQRKKAGEFDKSRFQVDVKKKEGVCPQGQLLHFQGYSVNKQDEPVLRFRGTFCPQCPCREKCTKGKFRTITVLKVDPLIKKMEAKMDSGRGKEMMKLRRSTVEPVFGVLKEQMNMRRFRMRGLANVNCELKLAATGYNLRKLHKIKGLDHLNAAMAAVNQKIQQTAAVIKDSFFAIFNIFPKIGIFPPISFRRMVGYA